MQFTPKKKRSLTGFRFNPYASGGRTYLGQYKVNLEKNSKSTPRKKIFKPSSSLSCRKSLESSFKKSVNLTDDLIEKKILHSDLEKVDTNADELSKTLYTNFIEEEVDPLLLQPILKPKETYSSAKLKRLTLPQDDIFPSSDEEFDKENSISNFTLSNSFYRKEATPKRSSILLDISPVTVQNGTLKECQTNNASNASPKEFKFKRFKKEYEPAEPEQPHMIGFPNYGNTCYLNSVLQSLMGLLPFMIDLANAQNIVNLSTKSITSSVFELISGRQKCSGNDVKKALRFLKENIERVDEAFAGCKMQDANEFLTQILDNIKDEIGQVSDTISPSNNFENTEIKSTCSWENDDSENEMKPHSIFSISSDAIDDTLLATPDKSGDQSRIINPVEQNFAFDLLETYKCLGCEEMVFRVQEHFALYVNLPKEDEILSIQKSVEAYMSEDQREVNCEKCGHTVASVITRFTKLPRILIVQLKRYEYNQEQFECIKVSAKVDLNVWLNLGSLTATVVDTAPQWIPQPLVISNDFKARSETNINIFGGSTAAEEENTTENSVEIVANSPKKEADTSMDDLQIVPFNDSFFDKEEEELQMAIKLSLQDNGMCYSTDDTSDEASSEEAFSEEDDHAYRLLSVISHFGQTTSTGHYVADVLNCQENQWYHYDDETVAKLHEGVLLAEGRQKNAYIYFYVDKNLFEELSKTTSS